MSHWDYIEAGFKVFSLHGVTNGACDCGNPECKALYKHPRTKNWQHTPAWTDEQVEVMEITGQFDTGFGVLCEGWLIIDVDARNGGYASYQKLLKDIPAVSQCGFEVLTGSGGGSRHLYFKLAQDTPKLMQSLQKYPGIDFKTSGYVVGAGSQHVSGKRYAVLEGSPTAITKAPGALIKLLEQRVQVRDSAGTAKATSAEDVLAALEFCEGYESYKPWLAVGISLYDAFGGSQAGLDAWFEWSKKSKKHVPDYGQMSYKYYGFGKHHDDKRHACSIFYEAMQNGYTKPVTFDDIDDVEDKEEPKQSEEWDEKEEAPFSGSELPFDVSDIDLESPPGFVGELTSWINSSSMYLRKRIAVATSLVAAGNLGMHYRDKTDTTPNLMTLCVAGSGTGKDTSLKCFSKIMTQGHMQLAIHGDIKSKQEIIRNLIEHQIAAYCTDEIGEILKTIENAKKKGGAAYLEGITGEIMKIFTKANDTLMVSGDVRRELLKSLRTEIAALEKQLISLEEKAYERRTQKQEESDNFLMSIINAKIEKIKPFILQIESTGGIPQPFFSMIGFTTPESFEPCLSVDLAKNGFLSRAFLIQERDTNPRPNPAFEKQEMPESIKQKILQITSTGEYSAVPGSWQRIEVYDHVKKIKDTPEASDLLARVMDWQWHFAEWHRAHTGFEALVRRFYEFVAKISLCLAIGDGGIRTAEHVRWAARYVKLDIDEKIQLLRHVESQESKEAQTVLTGVKERIHNLTAEGMYRSRVIQQVLKRKDLARKDVESLIDKMAEDGSLKAEGKMLYSNARIGV